MIDVNNIPRYHVYPLNDLREHKVDDHTSCWCHPAIDEDGIVVHNSMDGREAYENGLRKLS